MKYHQENSINHKKMAITKTKGIGEKKKKKHPPTTDNLLYRKSQREFRKFQQR